MSHKLIDEFYWNEIEGKKDRKQTADEKYREVVRWASKARGRNPSVFDALTEWILDDSQWSEDKLAENEQILMQGVLTRFKAQNANLRVYLKELESSGVVNEAVFKALDIFDDELSGNLSTGGRSNEQLSEIVAKVFTDFSIMKERSVREQIAGNKTGPYGIDGVVLLGYIQYLKGSDASVQWALYMPDLVKRQQDGFKVEKFEYKTMPAIRFIGKESCECGSSDTDEGLKGLFNVLDNMSEYKSGFDYDVLFQHHYGKAVNVERWHGFWGRFMKADTPVPE